MKLNKIYLLGLLASAMLTACGDDDDNFSPGEEPGSYNVTFAGEENYALDLTAKSFEINLERPAEASAQALTVPIVVEKAADVLSVPASATFEAGQSTATVTIDISDAAKAFEDYQLVLSLPMEYAGSTYKVQDTYPRLSITVHKEDYKPWGKLTYYSWYFSDDETDTWDSDVYYSEYLDMYRCDIFFDGFPFYFKVKEGESISFCAADGSQKIDTNIGYDHPTYGSMYLRWITDYDVEYDEGFYWFVTQYRVSAGSFGTNYDAFALTAN